MTKEQRKIEQIKQKLLKLGPSQITTIKTKLHCPGYFPA